MKLTVLFVLFSVFLKLKAEEDLDCQIDGITGPWGPLGIKLDPITDTHEGKIATFTTKNIEEIHVVDNTKDNYLKATFEKSILTIFPSENFKDFEKNRKGSFNSRTSIEIKFNCVDKDSPLSQTFHQEVIDTNNHLPIFEKNRYEYYFAMAIPIDFELTTFQDIQASDDDFMNDKIYFTTVSDEINVFKIEKTGRSNAGFYSTSLKALQNIPPPFKQEFIIIVTDSGIPPSSTNATVVVHVSSPEDESSENDTDDHPPVFTKHLYSADYTLENSLNMEEDITMKYGAKDNMEVQQSGYNEYFKITQSTLEKERLEVQIVQKLTEDILKNSYITIDIEVKNSGSSYQGLATLLINLPGTKTESGNDHPPIFSKNVYIATYTLENTLNMDEKITIKYGANENMVVRQSGYEEYFKIQKNPASTEELDVHIQQLLPDEMLTSNYLQIDISVYNAGSPYESLSTLLINLPSNENENDDLRPPVFSKSAYFANYTSDHKLNIEETITIKYGTKDNTIIKQSGYEEYIKVSLNVLNTTELKVDVIKPLNNETLKNDIIVIEITAENEGLSIPTRSNLILHLQNNFESSCQNVIHVFGYSIDGSIFPLVLFLSSITLIVFINVAVISFYFKKNRTSTIA